MSRSQSCSDSCAHQAQANTELLNLLPSATRVNHGTQTAIDLFVPSFMQLLFLLIQTIRDDNNVDQVNHKGKTLR